LSEVGESKDRKPRNPWRELSRAFVNVITYLKVISFIRPSVLIFG
jgi:hypothetical protein